MLELLRVDRDERLLNVDVTVASSRLTAVLASVTDVVADLSDTVKSLEVAGKTGEERDGRLRDDVARLTDAVAALQGLAALPQAVEAAREEVCALRKQVDDLRVAEDERRLSASELEARVGDVENRRIPDVGPLQQDVARAVRELEGVREDAAAAASKLGLLSTHTSGLKEQVDAQKEAIGAVQTTAHLVHKVFGMRREGLEAALEARHDAAAAATTVPPTVEYLLRLPVFAHVARQGDRWAERIGGCEAEVRRCDGRVNDWGQKVSEMLVAKVDKEAFGPVEAEVRDVGQRMKEVQRDFARVEESVGGKVAREEFEKEVAHLASAKAERSEMFKLPAKEDLAVLKKQMQEVERKMAVQAEAFAVEMRQVARRASGSGAGGGPPPGMANGAGGGGGGGNGRSSSGAHDLARVAGKLDELFRGQAQLQARKVDKSEWAAVQEYVDQLTESVERLRHAAAAAAPLKQANVAAAAAAAAAPTAAAAATTTTTTPPVPAKVKSLRKVVEYNNGTAATSVAASAGAASTPDLKSPLSAGFLSGASLAADAASVASSLSAMCASTVVGDPRQHALLRAPRPRSAGVASYTTLSCDDQISTQLPLNPLPAGVRMGRPARLTSADGSATNASMTPSVDLLMKYPLSPPRNRITNGETA